MSRKYKFYNKHGLYFVSFAVIHWIDVFTRHVYFNVLVESINYCRKEKGMELYAYCFMPSHVHFIFRSTNQDPSGLLMDFKRHTSNKIIEAIEIMHKKAEKNGCFGYLSVQVKRMPLQENINFGSITINP